jgi:hypothetical protein
MRINTTELLRELAEDLKEIDEIVNKKATEKESNEKLSKMKTKTVTQC